MFEGIRRAVGIMNFFTSIPVRRRRTGIAVFTSSPPEFLESRQLLTASSPVAPQQLDCCPVTPQLVGVESSSVVETGKVAKSSKKDSAPNIVGSWELTGNSFVGYLIVNSQNDGKISAVLTANATFTFPEISFEATLKGSRLSAKKFHHTTPTIEFTGKLKVQLDSATTLHGEIRGKHNGDPYKFSFMGLHIADI